MKLSDIQLVSICEAAWRYCNDPEYNAAKLGEDVEAIINVTT